VVEEQEEEEEEGDAEAEEGGFNTLVARSLC